LLRLAIRVRREDAELVLAELLELAPSGVEEVELDDAIEYAVYGAPGELPALPDLQAAVGAALVEVSTTELADDWAERWREFHQPLVLDGRLTVRPPWEPPGKTPIDVVIDPGQAFGTGAHASTRLCLELLLELASSPTPRPRGALLDLGCGSGVLGIVADRLGWGPVKAVDHDAASVQATRENAAANGVELEVSRLDLRTDPLPAAPTVVANLLSPLLIACAPAIAGGGAGGEGGPREPGGAGGPREPGGEGGPREAGGPRHLIASGILVPEADEVASAFAAHGLNVSERRVRGEWAALLLARAES
jgi:ribosomal protein L11 methyltransferase